MSQVEVMVGGRSYKMAVEEGQEQRVKSVAAQFDNFVQQMQKAAPNMDRDNILVLAGIMMSDDFLTHRQESEQKDQTLTAFHNTLASRLEKLSS